jgi:hypothetical protein
MNPVLALLAQAGQQAPSPIPQMQVPPPNPMVSSGMGGNVSNVMAQMGAQGPTPPIKPVVDVYDNTPPIVREAIRRRLFTQGM